MENLDPPSPQIKDGKMARFWPSRGFILDLGGGMGVCCSILKGASHLGKNPEISVRAIVEFPIGKKLFHLVLNPGRSQCLTVDLELVQTTRNVNGTRHSVRKFQPGKRAHLFRFSTFSGNFLVGRAHETCSI